MLLLKLLGEIGASTALGDRENARGKALLFVTCLDAHFQDEEGLMASSSYPGMDGHIESHRRAMASVFAFVDALESGALPGAIEDMIRDITAYFFNVLLQDDFVMARHVMAQGAPIDGRVVV